MRTAEEVKDYLDNNKIAGRYHRKNIRELVMRLFPEDRRFVFKINFYNGESKEITYNDFKVFLDEGDNI